MKGKKLLVSVLLAVTIAVVVAVPVIAAESSDTTEITGEVLSFIDVTAPSDISLGVMGVGDNTGSSDTPGSVLCNAEYWQIIAEDQKGTDCGYMVSMLGPLDSMLQISETDSSYEPVNPGITYGGNPTVLDLYVLQEVVLDDSAGSYVITITFTGVLE